MEKTYKNMKINKKIIAAAVLSAALLAGFGYLLIGNPVIFYHNYQLKKSVSAVRADHTTLNDIVPFEWESVYTFSSYTSREEIERVIGFQSRSIKETVSENMVQLLFVNDGSVTASICGYESSLGYGVYFDDCVTYGEKAVFTVSRDSDAVRLTEEKEAMSKEL